MIERIVCKDLLTFEKIVLDIDSNLVIFTGPSGAGKSVLISGILSAFGFESVDASVCEIVINQELNLESEELENEALNVFRYTKKDKSRYMLNDQTLSKKKLSQLCSRFVSHLSSKNDDEFSSEKILFLLDVIGNNKYINEYTILFDAFQKDTKLFEKICEDENKLEELKEFARFEIDKINSINPKEGELEELLRLKKELSKKEKIEQAIEQGSRFFEIESSIAHSLSLLEIQSDFLDAFSNELSALYEETKQRLSQLENEDIESMLDRIEKISDLLRRFGSVEACIEYKNKKEKELLEYEQITFTKENLQKQIEQNQKKVSSLAKQITHVRKEALEIFTQKINTVLEELYLPSLVVQMEQTQLSAQGADSIAIFVQNTPIEKTSSGEFNRMRLALRSVQSEYLQNGGVMILDEIDANLSGKESMSVARVLQRLSKHYQIFAISHQPQLSSIAKMHVYVGKDGGKSFIKVLQDEQRVEEIARIISGDTITQNATLFAKELLQTGLEISLGEKNAH